MDVPSNDSSVHDTILSRSVVSKEELCRSRLVVSLNSLRKQSIASKLYGYREADSDNVERGDAVGSLVQTLFKEGMVHTR